MIQGMEYSRLMEIVDQVRDDLNAYGGSIEEVAIGTGLSTSWIYQFKRAAITNPTVESVDKLAAYLDQV